MHQTRQVRSACISLLTLIEAPSSFVDTNNQHTRFSRQNLKIFRDLNWKTEEQEVA